MKAQPVRLIDVFIIGPGLVYVASRKRVSGAAKVFLAITGAFTIAYNLKNYIELERMKNAN